MQPGILVHGGTAWEWHLPQWAGTSHVIGNQENTWRTKIWWSQFLQLNEVSSSQVTFSCVKLTKIYLAYPLPQPAACRFMSPCLDLWCHHAWVYDVTMSGFMISPRLGLWCHHVCVYVTMSGFRMSPCLGLCHHVCIYVTMSGFILSSFLGLWCHHVWVCVTMSGFVLPCLGIWCYHVFWLCIFPLLIPTPDSVNTLGGANVITQI